MITVSDFEIIRPPFQTAQHLTLEWLSRAHVKVEGVLRQTALDHPEMKEFHTTIQEQITRVGCKPHQIHQRGHVVSLEDLPAEHLLELRLKIFDRYVTEVFEQLFPLSSPAPDDLIHVTCTGYVAPSGAQKLVSVRGWGHQTVVTHAYHMGCYGAIPALRMAQGFHKAGKEHIEVVHTELCSLHANPARHSLDQLVCQTLFADGCIKYTLRSEVKKTHFLLRAIQEMLIPNSRDAMSWNLSSAGFEMSLAKEIPYLIAASLELALKRIFQKAHLSYEETVRTAIFAIHPGGPKIISMIQRQLHLSEEQVRHSRTVLQNYGNMSSATLPHIWQAILQDDSMQTGSLVISLAFGPGLTFGATVMEKCGG
jgi:predicted naringenin-chalcone synthase